MLSLTFEEVHRDQQREVGRLRSGGFVPSPPPPLHPLPYRVAVRPDHHGSASRTVLGQLRLGQDILVPPWKVFLLGSQHRHLIALPLLLNRRCASSISCRMVEYPSDPSDAASGTSNRALADCHTQPRPVWLAAGPARGPPPPGAWG